MTLLDFDRLWAEREPPPLAMKILGRVHQLPGAKPAGLTLLMYRVRAERGENAKLNVVEVEQAARYMVDDEVIDRLVGPDGCSMDRLSDLVLMVLGEYYRREAAADEPEDDTAPGSFGGPADVIAHIATIEADFQREHGVDLAEALDVDGVSWRKFRNLLTGLSADSGWAQQGRRAAKEGRGGIEDGVRHLASVATPAAS